LKNARSREAATESRRLYREDPRDQKAAPKIPVKSFLSDDGNFFLPNKNGGDIEAFSRLVRLCAGRNGQLLNLTSLANDCGTRIHRRPEFRTRRNTGVHLGNPIALVRVPDELAN